MGIWDDTKYTDITFSEYNCTIEADPDGCPETNPFLSCDYSDMTVEDILEENVGILKQLVKLKQRLFSEVAKNGLTGLAEELSERIHRKYHYYERNTKAVSIKVNYISALRAENNKYVSEIG